MRTKILVVDDDPTLQTIIRLSLRDFDVVQAFSVEEAKVSLKQGNFSLILIDIMLPDSDGLRFLGEVKENKELSHIPVFIVSGKSEIQNKVMAFSVGADDFISKPFDPLELFARVNAKVSKTRLEMQSLKQKIIGNLMIDMDRHAAYRFENGSEQNLNLTLTEFKILVLLTQRLEQVYSRDQILDRVWGNTYVSDRTVDSHVGHLRSKLEGMKVVIDTVKNIGFRAVSA